MALLILVGCGEKHEPQPTSEDATEKQEPPKLKDDETLIRECVEGWLRKQELAETGNAFWDAYVTTPADTPNLPKVHKAWIKADKIIAERNDRLPTATVCTVPNLLAVRSWKILSFKIRDDLTQEVMEAHGREGIAKVTVRIDSSNASGSQITKDWIVSLYKDIGRWGIYEVWDGINL